MAQAAVQQSEAGGLPAKCATCDAQLSSPAYCSGCHTLRAADGASYFQLFGLPASFDLDVSDLRQRYFQLSRAVHPDRSAASESDALSLQLSSRANHAFQVLLNPLLRAEYLLELCGGESAAQDKSVPQAVLNETLIWREEIDEARDHADDAALAALRGRIQARFDHGSLEIGALSRQLPGDANLRRGLRCALNSIRYYQRMLEQFAD